MAEIIRKIERCAGGNHVTLTVEDDATGKERTIPMLWADFAELNEGRLWREKADADALVCVEAVRAGKDEIAKGGDFASIKARVEVEKIKAV
jgi:hypothetical protein